MMVNGRIPAALASTDCLTAVAVRRLYSAACRRRDSESSETSFSTADDDRLRPGSQP